MLGLIFSGFIEMVEAEYGLDTADRVILSAQLENNGAFTDVGYYKAEQLLAMVTALSDFTQKSENEILKHYGNVVFQHIAEAHGEVLQQYRDLFHMLEHLDDEIHVLVKQLYENANLPRFKVVEREHGSLVLAYHSERRLEYLAVGLLTGAAVAMGESITAEIVETDEAQWPVHIIVKKSAC